LTELSHDEIAALDDSRVQEPERCSSQIALAEQLTRLVHGPAGLESAQRATRVLFGEEIGEQDAGQLLDIFADVPSVELSQSVLEGEGYGVLDAFVTAGLAKSKGEVRRSVEQGGAYVNNRRVDNDSQRLTLADLVGGSLTVLRSGRKKYALLRFAPNT
jgi:tyrosyl-tRNA synthetase